MEALENVKETIDSKMGKTSLQLLANSVPVEASDESEEEFSDESDLEMDEDEEESEGSALDSELDDEDLKDLKQLENGPPKRRLKSIEGYEFVEENKSETWSGLADKAVDQYKMKKQKRILLSRFVYTDEQDENFDESESEGESGLAGGLFKISRHVDEAKNKRQLRDQEDGFHYLQPSTSGNSFLDGFKEMAWTNEELRGSIRDCFVTGKWDADEDEANKLKGQYF